MSADQYKHKVRIRTGGLLIKDESILLVRIQSPVSASPVWMPPGGGLEFGESLVECLEREFKEETGLVVTAGEMQFINEMIKPPFHAIEFYYLVSEKGGSLGLGTDPEHHATSQLIKDIKWIPVKDCANLAVSPAKLSSYLNERFL